MSRTQPFSSLRACGCRSRLLGVKCIRPGLRIIGLSWLRAATRFVWLVVTAGLLCPIATFLVADIGICQPVMAGARMALMLLLWCQTQCEQVQDQIHHSTPQHTDSACRSYPAQCFFTEHTLALDTCRHLAGLKVCALTDPLPGIAFEQQQAPPRVLHMASPAAGRNEDAITSAVLQPASRRRHRSQPILRAAYVDHRTAGRMALQGITAS